MTTKRTQDEIVARIKARKPDDFFGFEVSQYMNFLDYDHAREFLKSGTTKKEASREEWGEVEGGSPEDIIKGYLPFAWGKANDCRGISANRSIEHMVAWLWLDGKDWLEKDYDENYQYYGKPQLVRICEEYGVDWRALDDNEWRNSESGKAISADKALGRKPGGGEK